ncbi:MAG: hypothetical protein ACJAYB_001904 [Psychromonas sp.]|jgi:hypothetical protein
MFVFRSEGTSRFPTDLAELLAEMLGQLKD